MFSYCGGLPCPTFRPFSALRNKKSEALPLHYRQEFNEATCFPAHCEIYQHISYTFHYDW